MQASDDLGLVGRVVDGRFRVDVFVGRGDLSLVYKGFDVAESRAVAIKCLNVPQGLDGTMFETLARRFREGSLVHFKVSQGCPHIAKSLASGATFAPRTAKEIPFFVREWLEGYSLAQDFAARRAEGMEGRPIAVVLELLAPAAEALAHAHANGIVHQRVSPQNLFVAATPGGSVLKVLDFGVARAMHVGPPPGEPTAQRPEPLDAALAIYIAPEQLDPSLGETGPPADVYALALLVLEALRDRPPIRVPPGADVKASILDPDARPSPAALGMTLGKDVDALLERCVSLRPQDRPRDARELWDALTAAVEAQAWETGGGAGSSGRLRAAPRVLGRSAGTGDSTTDPLPPPAPPPSSRDALPFPPSPSAPAGPTSERIKLRVPPPTASPKGLELPPLPTPPAPSSAPPAPPLPPPTHPPVLAQPPAQAPLPAPLPPPAFLPSAPSTPTPPAPALPARITPTPTQPAPPRAAPPPAAVPPDGESKRAVGPIRPPTPALPFKPEASVIVDAPPAPPRPPPSRRHAPTIRMVRDSAATMKMSREELLGPEPPSAWRYVVIVVVTAATVVGAVFLTRKLIERGDEGPVSSPTPSTLSAPPPLPALDAAPSLADAGSVTGDADTAPKPFDRVAAKAALDAIAPGLTECKLPKTSTIRLRITFGNDGGVTAAQPMSPYIGMPQGICAAKHVKDVHVAPYKGTPAPNVYAIVIPR